MLCIESCSPNLVFRQKKKNDKVWIVFEYWLWIPECPSFDISVPSCVIRFQKTFFLYCLGGINQLNVIYHTRNFHSHKHATTQGHDWSQGI